MLILGACTTAEPPGAPTSLRERLELADTTLVVAQAESGGAVTASRKTSAGWSGEAVDLAITDGVLVVRASAAGAVRLDELAIAIAPIEIPESVLGYPAQLTDIELGLAQPAAGPTTWSDGDHASATLQLDLALTWSFASHGGAPSPLGSPDLPPVPVELVLDGDGSFATAELRASAPGELWTWANLLRFEDLSLVLLATTMIETSSAAPSAGRPRELRMIETSSAAPSAGRPRELRTIETSSAAPSAGRPRELRTIEH